MKQIIVTTDKIGFHQYKDAPTNVKFLKNIHRHKFYIRLGIEVFDDNRELEFFTVQAKLNTFLQYKKVIGSCEMLATEIHQWASKEYPNRKIFAEVWEDKENGARVE